MNVITLSASRSAVGQKRTRGAFNNSIDAERNQAANVQSLQRGRRYATRRVANHLMEKSAKEALQKFVENNILSRDCTTYIPQSSQDTTCCCGYSKQWHMIRKIDVDDGDAKRDVNRGKAGLIIVSNPRNDEDLSDTARKWDDRFHVGNFSNKCYGVIQFSGFGVDKSRCPVPYVRISTESSLKTALELLTEHWLLRRPKLVVSILGSDENFFKREKEKAAFKKAVVDLIQNTGGISKTAPGKERELSQGAWVITNGFGSGATQCVAEAINEYAAKESLMERLNIAIIGVCHWGSLDGTDMLTPPESGGFFPAKYEKRILLSEANRTEKIAKILDFNHTHFILYDDGKGNDDDLRTWRCDFENFIASELMVIRRDQDIEWLKYPMVRLLVKGDTNEIETATKVYGSTPRFKIPMLILKDERHDETTRTMEDKELIPNSKKKISAGTLVTTCLLESEPSVIDLKEPIRNAVLSANRGSTPPQEVQGLIAAGLIRQVSDASAVHLSLQKIRSSNRLHEFLMYALINKQHEIVELILHNGVDLQKFLTSSTLKNLYLQILDNPDEDLQLTFLRHLVKKHKRQLFDQNDEWKKFQAVGCLLSELVGHDRNLKYTAPWIENSSTVDESEKQGTWENSPVGSPQKHLMLWAIFFNLDKMALLFWRTGKNHIGCALLAAKLSKNLAKKAKETEMDDFFESYHSLANTFEYQATNILHNCYLQNTRLTELCLTRRINDLGKSTALSLAHDAKLIVFMDHVSYQQQLDNIWMGGMAPKTSLLKLIFTALFPLILIFRLHFVRQSFAGHDGESALRSHTAVSTVTERIDSTVPETVVDTESTEVPCSEKKINLFGLFTVCAKPDREIKYKTALRIFFSAPVTKFVYSMMSYFTFLAIYSVFILHELAKWTGPAGSRFEIVVWIWTPALLAEFLWQVTVERNKLVNGSSTRKLLAMKWFRNLWNLLDISAFVSLLISIVISKLKVDDKNSNVYYGRMAHAVCGSLLVIRSMRAFRVSENLGPKLIILQKMVYDVAIFFGILAVFLFSFGISYRALVYPQSQLNAALLENVLYNPYFIIFGQVPIDKINGGMSSKCNTTIHSSIFGEEDACPQASMLADVYLALYCFIANILIINLLIAMFNFTFSKVQKNSTRLWKYQRFSLVHEFYQQPTLPAPLSLPFTIYKFTELCRRSKSKETISGDAFERELSAEETRQVLALERRAMEQVTALINNISLSTRQRSLAIQEKLEKVLEEAKQMQTLLDSHNCQKNKTTQRDTLA